MRDGTSGKKSGDSLRYIQGMLRELREQAAAERHDMLAFLIEMAYIEASDQLRGLHDNEAEFGRYRSKF